MKTQLKTEIKNTYWQSHKIIFADPEPRYKTVINPAQSKQKNIISKYGNLQKFYENT